MYTYFECVTSPINEKRGKKITWFLQHQPSGFSLETVRFDGKNQHVQYSGNNAADRITEIIEKVAKDFYEEFNEPKPMIITAEMNEALRSATKCCVCDELLEDTDEVSMRVRDHNHYTGEFCGVAHSKCNLLLKKPKFIPVFLHNLGGYDKRLFLRKLANNLGYTKCIASNEEKFITLS